MLINNSVYRESYVGNGVQTQFPVLFPFLQNAHLAVDLQNPTDTVPTRLTLNTHYTVTGAGMETGGVVTLLTAPVANAKLVIYRNVPYTQGYKYRDLDNFPAESHENALALLTMQCQQLQEQIDRSLMVTSTSGTDPSALIDSLLVSEANSAASAASAATSATSAATSATSAATAASTAQTAASDAAGSAALVDAAVASAQADIVASAAFVPIGAILDFPVNTVPAGFLVCAGQTVTRAAYPELVAYLTGDSAALSTTLPDLRGEFRRGADLGRGVDAGRVAGSWQADAYKAHSHPYTGPASRDGNAASGSTMYPMVDGDNLASFTVDFTSTQGGTETRPRNVAVVSCIKAYHAPMSATPVDLTAALEHLDALAAVVSPSVGKYCTVYPNNSTQQSFPANATTVVSNNGAQASIGENWPGAGDGSLSIVIPEDGVYELTAVVALYSGAASSVAWGWITVNGVSVLESVDYCQMVIQDALQLRAVRQLVAGTVVRAAIRPSALAAGGAGAANNLTVMRVR